MDCYGKKHQLFQRMRHDGNATWAHVCSWWSTPRASSWESQVYTKSVASTYKNAPEKNANTPAGMHVRGQRRPLLFKPISRLHDFEHKPMFQPFWKQLKDWIEWRANRKIRWRKWIPCLIMMSPMNSWWYQRHLMTIGIFKTAYWRGRSGWFPPYPYHPTSQLLKADVFPLEQVTTVSLCHVLPCAVSYMSREEIRRGDAKNPLLHHEHW